MNDLPTPDQMYALLCTHGAQFTSADQDIRGLTGVDFTHPEKGVCNAQVNARALAANGSTYANSHLSDALRRHGGRVTGLSDVVALLERYLHKDNQGLVWGFSGYATAGRDYHLEALAMKALYRRLVATGNKPTLTSDGASAAGVLGLNGLLAAQYGIPSLGYAPLEGLDDMAPRNHMVIGGVLYRDREPLVGATPDVLVCVGGGEGTRRECIAALEHGSVVLILALKDYGELSFASSYLASSEVFNGIRERRVFVCTSLEEVERSTIKVLQAAIFAASVSRPARMRTIRQLLAD